MRRGAPRPRNQITYPAARPTHRRLIIGAIIVIILGGAFLFFWQTVLQFIFAPEPTWDLEFCTRQLARHAPALADFELVPVTAANGSFVAEGAAYINEEGLTVRAEGINEVVLSCQAEIITASSTLGDVGDAYDCQGVIVRYNSEETEDWLLTGVQIENTVPGNPTPFIDLITYYNPGARVAFESRLSALQAHSCVI